MRIRYRLIKLPGEKRFDTQWIKDKKYSRSHKQYEKQHAERHKEILQNTKKKSEHRHTRPV